LVLRQSPAVFPHLTELEVYHPAPELTGSKTSNLRVSVFWRIIQSLSGSKRVARLRQISNDCQLKFWRILKMIGNNLPVFGFNCCLIGTNHEFHENIPCIYIVSQEPIVSRHGNGGGFAGLKLYPYKKGIPEWNPSCGGTAYP
jgi:hypothetical protein